jgi:polysaccharide deacetylase 2 family uncharacterized protein YibQ
MRLGRRIARLASAAALPLVLGTASADDTAAAIPETAAFVRPARDVDAARTDAPRIAVIIDDLGYRWPEGVRAARLPGPVAVAVLPGTTYADALAREADALGKEIVVHVPMQARAPAGELGPGALDLAQSRAELERALADDLAAVPLARAVSNHMGSSLTSEPERMRWVMEALRAHGVRYFVDSYTTVDSVALAAAGAAGVPAVRRDVFLDGDPAREAIEREWRRLVDRARERGVAIAIGHPRAATLDLLERELPRLKDQGIVLVPPSALLDAAATP